MNINLIKFLSKLKNASISKQEVVSIDYNKLCLGVVKLLYKEGFIQSFSIKKISFSSNVELKIFITLRYFNNKPIFKNLKIVSTPSRLNYLNIKDLSKISNKKIILILSTNKGLLTSLECKKHKIGGKLLFAL
jgi:small subunit ribosomal protein S8|tara:strand:- start:5078 stop:5476 length:399 start_codon:yes stop_codon:yes gene_type:complete